MAHGVDSAFQAGRVLAIMPKADNGTEATPAVKLCFYLALFIIFVNPAVKVLSQNDPDRVFALSWNSTGTQLASAGIINGQNGVEIRDTSNTVVLFIPTVSHVLSISWSPDNSKLAVVYRSAPLDIATDIIEATTGNVTSSIVESGSKTNPRAYWNPNINKSQIATIISGQVNIWDYQTEQIIGSIPFGQPIEGVIGLGWTSDGSELFAISDDQFVRVWNPDNQQLLRETQLSPNGRIALNDISLSPDGTKLAVFTSNVEVVILDISTLAVVSTMTDATNVNGSLLSGQWHPNGEQIASYGSLGINIWNVQTGDIIQTLETPDGVFAANPRALDFSPDGLLTYSFYGNNIVSHDLTKRASYLETED